MQQQLSNNKFQTKRLYKIQSEHSKTNTYNQQSRVHIHRNFKRLNHENNIDNEIMNQKYQNNGDLNDHYLSPQAKRKYKDKLIFLDFSAKTKNLEKKVSNQYFQNQNQNYNQNLQDKIIKPSEKISKELQKIYGPLYIINYKIQNSIESQKRQVKDIIKLRKESIIEDRSSLSFLEKDNQGYLIMKNYYYKQDYLANQEQFQNLTTEQKVKKVLDESIFQYTGTNFFLNEFQRKGSQQNINMRRAKGNFLKNLNKKVKFSELISKQIVQQAQKQTERFKKKLKLMQNQFQ